MHRLFIGLRPPVAMRRQLLAIMDGVEAARWQDDDQLHVTLRYVGEVERPVAEDIATILRSVHAPALDLSLAGIGMFDRRGRPTALWAGVAPVEPLAALHRKIDHALVRIGLPAEGRAYRPHITLARLNAAAGPVDSFLAAHGGLTSPPMRVDGFLLYESHLGHDGARYEAVARYAID